MRSDIIETHRRLKMEFSMGNIIKQLRTAKGWTQAELAEKINVTNKAVSKWESNLGCPEITILPKLAEIFEVTTDYLLTGKSSVQTQLNDGEAHSENAAENNQHNNEINTTDDEQITEEKAEKSTINIEVALPADYENIVEAAIKDGIVDIQTLLDEQSPALVRYALEKYPISHCEILNKLYNDLQYAAESDDWRFIFEYAVDNNEKELAKHAASSDRDGIIRWIEDKRLIKLTPHYEDIVLLPSVSIALHIIENGNHNALYMEPKDDFENYAVNTIPELNEYIIKYAKPRIIDIIEAHYKKPPVKKQPDQTKLEKERILKDYDRQYFEKQYALGNTEILLRNLCKRLETVLRNSYSYEGTFSEILNKYCKEYNMPGTFFGEKTEDIRYYFMKLRNYSDSIPAENKSPIKMTDKEIKFCINYICNMN